MYAYKGENDIEPAERLFVNLLSVLVPTKHLFNWNIFKIKQALLDDMDMRQSALKSIKAAAEELIKQASNDKDEAVQGGYTNWI